MVGSLIFGSADISMGRILEILFGKVTGTDGMVIWNIRFPRNIVGALVGADLAVAGAILQAVMKIRSPIRASSACRAAPVWQA